MCGEVWVPVRFGVSEYTLVFRRAPRLDRTTAANAWIVARPSVHRPRKQNSRSGPTTGPQEIFAVAIVSTLALDEVAYERFLAQSGVLHEAVAVLGTLKFSNAENVELVRRRIQSLVMAAEVDEIVSGMTKGA
jgi:hypothetical protein